MPRIWKDLFRRRGVEREIEDEIAFHVECRAGEYRAQGFGPEEALRRARLDFGPPQAIREEVRDARGWTWLAQAAQDLRYAWRNYRRNPGFTLAAVGILGLGIGLTLALASILYGLLYRPLPAPQSDRLLNLYVRTEGRSNRSTGAQSNRISRGNAVVSWVEFQFLRAQAKSAEVAGLASSAVSWKGYTAGPVRVHLVSANLLPMMGARPALGRLFSEEECSTPGAAPVAVLSHEFWKARLGAEPGVVGRTLTFNRVPFQVAGVVQEGFRSPIVQQADFYAPLTMQRALIMEESDPFAVPYFGWIQVFGRLRPGHSVASAQSEFSVLGQSMLEPHNRGRTARVAVVRASFLSDPRIVREAALGGALLLAAAGLILLLCCANVANLLLARGLARGREIAIRLSIGAGRGRLVRQLLIESGLLAAAAGAVGLLSGLLAARGLALIEFDEAGLLPIDLRPDLPFLLFVFALTGLTGLFFGLFPALQSLRVDVNSGLRGEAALPGDLRRRHWIQQGLVMAQVAICAVLLAGAGLLFRGLLTGSDADVGLVRENVWIAGFDFREQGYDSARARLFLDEFQRRAAALPGVAAAGSAVSEPFVSQCTYGVDIAELPAAQREWLFECFETDQGYPEALGVKIVAGRGFTPEEVQTGAPVVMIDETAARRLFPGQSAAGRRLTFDKKDVRTVVGVTTPVRYLDIAWNDLPDLYYPPDKLGWLMAQAMVRTSSGQPGLGRRLQDLARELDSGLNCRVRRIEENVEQALAGSRLASRLVTSLGVLALILAISGIYAVVAFLVNLRLREAGIRMALGAAPGEVAGHLLRRGLRPVLAGLLLGAAGAAALAQLLRGFLYGASPYDPAATLPLLAALGLAGALAAWLPARRAARVDPALTLRHE